MVRILALFRPGTVHFFLASCVLAAGLAFSPMLAKAATLTVSNQSGEDEPGSFPEALTKAQEGDTITFDENVTAIPLQKEGSTAAPGLTLTGRADGFEPGLETVRNRYGVNTLTSFVDTPPNSVAAVLQMAAPGSAPNSLTLSSLRTDIGTLTLPRPFISGDDVGKLLLFSSGNQNFSTTLSGLTLHRGLNEVKTDDLRYDQLPVNTGSSATGGISLLFSLTKPPAGGALRLDAPGTLDSMMVRDSLSIARAGQSFAGSFTSPDISNSAFAYAMAEAWGGGAYLAGAESIISSSIFLDNSVQALAGEARGGNAVANNTTLDMHANALATAMGGGAYFAGENSGVIGSIFAGNSLTATAGASTGGTGSGTGVLAGAGSGANAQSSVSVYGAGAYFEKAGGGIEDSLFVGNTGTATAAASQGGSSPKALADSTATAFGGGAYFDAGNVDISGSIFKANTLTALGAKARGGTAAGVMADASSQAGAEASGGGLYLGGNNSNVGGSAFLDNTLTATAGEAHGGGVTATASAIADQPDADGGADAGAEAYGGGLFHGGSESAVMYSILSGNRVTATAGTVRILPTKAEHGYIGPDEDNSADADADATAEASARTMGGGVLFGGYGISLNYSVLRNNSLEATGGNALNGDIMISASIVDPKGNATAVTDALAAAEASGGGAHFSGGSSSMSGSILTGNTLKATGGTAHAGNTHILGSGGESRTMNAALSAATALGAGAYFARHASEVLDSEISENRATAVGGTLARNGSSSGGTSELSWANADAYAFGGGLFFEQGTSVVTDSILVNNSVTATAPGQVIQNGKTITPEAEAKGGAIFVSTSRQLNKGEPGTEPDPDPEPELQLTATGGSLTLIAGNTANNAPDGIYFGRGGDPDSIVMTGYFPESHDLSTLTVTADGVVYLADPVTVDVYAATGAAFAMNVEKADGVFVWERKNVFDANGGATLTFKSGSGTLLGKDFSLTTTKNKNYRTGSSTDAYARSSAGGNDLTVVLAAESEILFSPERASTVALFDFTNATSQKKDGHFIAELGAWLDMDTERQLTSVSGTYLLADGISNLDRDTVAANLRALQDTTLKIDSSRDNQLWATAEYDSPYQSRIDRWTNLEAATSSLQALLLDRTTVSDSQFTAITRDLESTTPDYLLNQGTASLLSAIDTADTAVTMAFRDFRQARRTAKSGETVAMSEGPAAFSTASNGGSSALRPWGGYTGNFSRTDHHSGRRGYTHDSNGILAGLNYDFNQDATVGLYFGYTRGRTDLKGISSRVEADGLHVGLLGRVQPLRALPGLGISADVGYARFNNDGERTVAGKKITADFDQNVWTAGIGVDHEISFEGIHLTPFAKARHTRLDQDAVTEKGGLTATRTGSYDAKSFRTQLGAEAAWDIAAGSFTLSPTVSASWEHEFGDRDFSATSRFLLPDGSMPTGPIDSFTTKSVKVDRDSCNLGAGLKATSRFDGGKSLSFTVNYNANLSENQTGHAIQAGLEFRF